MEQFLKLTLDALTDNVIVLENNGLIIYANKAWKQFAIDNGSPSGTDYVGVNYLDVCDTSIGDESEEASVTAYSIRQIIAGHMNEFYVEYPCHTPTEKRWFSMRVTPLEGDAPRQVVIIHSNITERALVEQEVKTKHSQITSILNSVQDAIWSYTLPDKQVIYASPSFEKMYGYSADDFLQSYYKEIINPDFLDAFENTLKELEKNNFVDIEYAITYPNGTIRWIHQRMYVAHGIYDSSSQRMYGHDGSSKRIDAISRDITKLKLIEEQMLELQLQQERVKMLQNFVRDVSHDFRTPMSIVNTNLYFLSRTAFSHSQKKRIQTMESQVLRLEKLLDQMILMSKLDAINTEDHEFTTINMSSMLQNLYQIFSKQSEQKDLQLNLTVPSNSIEIYGNEEYLSRAIKNILENAILYTSKGDIDLNLKRIDSCIAIHIKDTGSGIASGDLPHIFDRFFRIDRARSVETGGSGLGLSISKTIIDMHSGNIEVISTLDEGTHVTINLPIHPSSISLSE
jgi:PAS domain S-box-containing protein